MGNNGSLPVAPEIVFSALFKFDGDNYSCKKGIFTFLKKIVREDPYSLNGGSNVVAASSKIKERFLEITLLTDAIIICEVKTRSPKARRLLFPPIPLTEVTAALSGHNNSIDVTLSAENILRLVELEAGRRDQFFETFSRLKDTMAAYEGISI